MKTLKTLNTEVLKDKMPEIEKSLHVQHQMATGRINGRVDCLPQCASNVYEIFGYSGKNFSADAVQYDIDTYYKLTGSAAGQGVLLSDFNTFMTAWFTGGPVTITQDYQCETKKPVIVVVRIETPAGPVGHAVQLLAINPGGVVLVKDPQNTCTDIYNLSQIVGAYESTGVVEYVYPKN